jgi:hypothetical protein
MSTKGFPRIAEIQLERSPDGSWILATVSNGDGGQYEHFVRNADGKWRRATEKRGCPLYIFLGSARAGRGSDPQAVA